MIYLGFQSYVDYIGIKNHFNNEAFQWNLHFQYNKIKLNSFEKRKDRMFFTRLEKECKERSCWIERLISGFLFLKSCWIGQLFEDEVINHHQDRLNRTRCLESLFKKECEKLEFFLFDQEILFNNLWLTTLNKDPILIKLFIKKEISLETLTILHHFTRWADFWIPINPLQQERCFQIKRYVPLLDLASKHYDRIENTYHQLAHPRVIAH